MNRYIMLLLALFVVSCGGSGSGSTTSADTTKASTPPQSMDAVTTAERFLQWYAQHYGTVSKINMVNNAYTGRPEDEGKDYSVNFAEAQRYLDSLKSSGYVSDKYLAGQMNEFKKWDQEFKVHPQKGGPPNGFEADLVLMTQEIDATLHAIDSPKVMQQQVTADSATVKLDVMMHLRFKLSRYNNKWLIDGIENSGLE